ncbi:MAG: hypothetical protein FJ264_16190 [Planctomycetes bacterium]|nr:hypothetical protein [Planctomycetota bacterium]
MKPLTIKGKILLFGLCISLIPITLITVIYYCHLRTLLRNQEINGLKAIAQTKNNHILSCITSKENRTIDFSSDGYIRERIEKIKHGKYSQNIVKSLDNYLRTTKIPIDHDLKGIHIVDAECKTITSTHEEITDTFISHEKDIISNVNFSNKKAYVTASHVCHFCNEKRFHIISPIYSLKSTQKKPLGYLITCYDLSAINEITTDYKNLGDTGEVYLVDKNKIMITDTKLHSKEC